MPTSTPMASHPLLMQRNTQVNVDTGHQDIGKSDLKEQVQLLLKHQRESQTQKQHQTPMSTLQVIVTNY